MRGIAMLFNAYSIRVLILSLIAICISGSVYAENQADSEPEITGTLDVETLYQKGVEANRINDMSEAMRLISLAADGGHSDAQYDLGYLYDKAEENEFAFKYYELSANQGNPKGMFGLAGLYMTGEGVDKNVDLALRWYEQAAQLKYVPALRVVAFYYEKGLGRTLPNFEKSANFYHIAAELGDMDSIRRLIIAREKGELGLSIDANQADFWKNEEARVLKKTAPVSKNSESESKK